MKYISYDILRSEHLLLTDNLFISQNLCGLYLIHRDRAMHATIIDVTTRRKKSSIG